MTPGLARVKYGSARRLPRSIRSLCLWGSILAFSATLGSSVPASAEVPPLNGDLTFARTDGVFRIGTEAIVRKKNVEPDCPLVGAAAGSRCAAPRPSGLAASDPTWSQDALRIAFAGRGAGNLDIWVVGSDARKRPKRLTTQRGADIEPDFSPGGEKIVFTSRRDGNLEIYVMADTGAGPVRLTSSPGTDRQPVWSPDGTKIAFASDRDGSLGIWMMDADGTKAVALTRGVGYATDPAWSPDGKRIAYATGSRGATSIVSVEARGADRRPVTSGAKGDRFPAWSPDGLQIAFSRGRKVMVAGVPSQQLGRGPATMAFGGERRPVSLTRGSNPDWGVLPIAGPAPAPEVSETADAKPEGKVTVQVPGAIKAAPLTNDRQLPVGTTVDTTRDKASVTLLAPVGDGRATKAVASEGRFTYTQTDTDEEGPVAVLDLPLPSGCASGGPASMPDSVNGPRQNSVNLSVEGLVELPRRVARAFAAKSFGKTKKKTGKGSGSNKGKVRRSSRGGFPGTRGTYPRGGSPRTEWTTTDQCDRTTFEVQTGVVEVEDFKYGNVVDVPAGSCYVAPSPFPVARQRCG